MRRCCYCGEGEVRGARGTPGVRWMCTERSRDGTDLKRNLTAACNVCNSIKGNRALEHARPNLIQQRIGWPRFNQKQLAWLRANGFDMSPYDNGKLFFEDECWNASKRHPGDFNLWSTPR
jgi:hypothetical protein